MAQDMMDQKQPAAPDESGEPQGDSGTPHMIDAVSAAFDKINQALAKAPGLGADMKRLQMAQSAYQKFVSGLSGQAEEAVEGGQGDQGAVPMEAGSADVKPAY